ncbi:death-associated protein kinase 3-like [Panulirus ornatus]|uniref:death-associated protein kinase 3-like n=1 Tax=Panulirus ornatus TaxID=150431 RepID=UPI003A865163
MKSEQQRKMSSWAKKKGIKVLLRSELRTLEEEGRRTRGNMMEGGFGVCVLLKLNGQWLVMKTFKRNQYTSMMRELRGLVRAKGPGVQELYAICPQRNVMLSKYAGDSLFSVIERGLSKNKATHIMGCVLRTTDRVLTEANICHNDLKPSNICVADIKSVEPKVTLIDYGLASTVGKLTYWQGMYPYQKEWVATELTKRGVCSEKSEVYSLGYVGRRINGNIRSLLPPGFRGWMIRSQSHDPESRPSVR